MGEFEARHKQLWKAFDAEHDQAVVDATARGASKEETKEIRKAIGQAHFGQDFPETADAVAEARAEFRGDAGHGR